MKLGAKIKEGISRIIGSQFSTNEIVNVFTDAGIDTDVSLYAKWKITLDGLNRAPTNEIVFHIITEFCHPLNFISLQARKDFIDSINNVLLYEDIEIRLKEKGVDVVLLGTNTSNNVKTSTDYIVEAVNFFKNEYNKVRILGLSYDYSLGENVISEQTNQDYDDYDGRLRAIKRLADTGFITAYKIEERSENEGYYIWDYAVCKIDETRLTGQKATPPPATEAGAKAVAQEVIHTHTHRFENSIQEKEIELNHKFAEEEEVVVKNKKKITLPKFPATEWGNVEIRFITDNDVYIKAGQKTVTADFEGLGFRNDKTGRPNTAWHFLLGLAKNNGQTKVIKSPIPDNIKQQKRTLSDRLKTIFKNDTDPFNDFSEDNTYRIKIKLLAPNKESNANDLGVDDYLKEVMVSEE